MSTPRRTAPPFRNGRLAVLALAVLALAVLAGAVGLRLLRQPAAGAPSAKPVRLAYLQNDLHHLPLWVALDTSLFREEGVAVTIAGVFRSGPEIMRAFGAGELDAAYVGEAPVTLAVARGAADLRVLAQANTEGSALVAGPGWAAGGRRERVVAIPGNGSVQDLLLRKALAQNGLAAGPVRAIVLSPPDMLTALGSGQIDGFVAWEPYPSRAVALGQGRVLRASADIWAAHPCCVLAADARFLAARAPEARALLRAHERAIAFIAARPDQAAAIAVKYTGMDAGVVREAMRHVAYTAQVSVAGELEYVRFLAKIGYVTNADPQTLTGRILGDVATPPAKGGTP